jgi:hypothetical protein
LSGDTSKVHNNNELSTKSFIGFSKSQLVVLSKVPHQSIIFQAFFTDFVNSLSDQVFVLSAKIISNHIVVAQALFKFLIRLVYIFLSKGNLHNFHTVSSSILTITILLSVFQS